jgi:pimeloyl-ACP methyl ester carboxylesterase
VALSTGLTVRVVEAGPVDGAPVVLVHGWGVHSYLWRRNIPALASAGRRVYALDLPGHGLSDRPLAPGSYALGALTSHVVALFDEFGIARAPIVAQSMGGRIAVEVARLHPERVAALALFGSVGFGETTRVASVLARLPAPHGALSTMLVRRWIIALGKAFAYGRRAPIAQEDIDAYWAVTQFPDFLAAMRRVLLDFDWRPLTPELAATISVPALVVFGTRDRTVRPVRAEERVAALPQGRLYWARDAGHVVNEEVSEEINPLLVQFLEESR